MTLRDTPSAVAILNVERSRPRTCLKVTTPLSGNELVALVQDGRNAYANVSMLSGSAFSAGASDLGNTAGSANRADTAPVTAYRWRGSDQEFAKAWEQALETGTDKLEDEALRRALHGMEEPVYHNGVPVGAPPR